MVWRWQQRFAEEGIEGLLRDKTRPPGIPPVPQAKVHAVVERTLREPPGAVTHWTGRAMAKAMGLSLRTIQRIWAAHKLQPHRIRTFKRSNDPDFAAKLDDVVGLYITRPATRQWSPSTRKARSRRSTGPSRVFPEAGEMRNPHARLQTPRHDDPVRRAQRARRQGHRPLRAAPSASGVHPLHRNRRAVRPGRQGDSRQPDNYAAHKHPQVLAWLAEHPRWTFHFTSTSCAWLNAVEGFFSKLTPQSLQRGVFRSIDDLESAITRYIAATNSNPKPLVWTATAKTIQAKLHPEPSV